ncbi:hypothetical protein FLGE108171_14700 [Flavobacterium gelidilacus]|uniref:hypothetical protein n=1 Tax=Flavobacterium gelidilacus TaxID=206041 RepID=UPI00047DD1FB|nr:hypothetical protein [Flavobacterium gelidilacus]
MNYIKHLTAFFDRIIPDSELNPTHVSLYMALFHAWNINRFINPISITRDEMMRISKICSKATYHKCMRDLNDKKLIKYEPSYNPYRGSLVLLFDFSEDKKPSFKKDTTYKKISQVDEQVVNKQKTSNKTSSEPASEQALVSSINYINNTNNVNIKKNENIKASEQKNVNQNESNLKDEPSKQKKLREKNKGFQEPTLEEVKAFFKEKQYPEIEGQKFFNYFSSIGWLVGGKTPMANWNAAAQNWMLNATVFNQTENANSNRAKHLNTSTDKDYAEPL